MSVKSDFGPLLKLAIPLALGIILQSSINFFGTIFLARISGTVLAAGALVTWFFAILSLILFGTFSSINILVAHKHGANDVQGISKVLRDGLLLAILFVIPTFLLVWHMTAIFLLFGQKPELIALAKLYLHGLAWGVLPKFIMIILFEFTIGLGHVRVFMVFTMISIPLYIFFTYVLIFGKFGFPELGIAGAGWGTALVDWISAILLCTYLLANKNYRLYISKIFNLNAPFFLWEILHLGVPMALMYFIEAGFYFAMTLLIGLIGVAALAANQVILQYLGPLMAVPFCIAQAITVRMGQLIGANQLIASERTGYAGILLATLFMMMIALIYWLLPGILISVDFNIHEPKNFEIVRLAKQFFLIAAFFQILEAIRISLFGALRGLKDTKFTLLASLISFWFIALPIGYALSIWFKLGGNGYWWGMVIGVSCNTILLYRRFKLKINDYGQNNKTIKMSI